MAREAELVTEMLLDCERTLSIGCGIGSIGGRIENHNIFCLDSSPHMLSEAKKRVKGPPLVLASAEMMPFKNSSFDCAYSVTALEFMETPEKQYEKQLESSNPTVKCSQ